ncbi:MAG: C40 family peptidase [Eubacterium sp.]|nr:C40 family peptidase [Eubacterium sp.]
MRLLGRKTIISMATILCLGLGGTGISRLVENFEGSMGVVNAQSNSDFQIISNTEVISDSLGSNLFYDLDGSEETESEETESEEELTGWNWEDYEKFVYYENGKKVTGWKTIDGRKFYFDKDGVLCTGLNRIDGKIYYLGTFDSNNYYSEDTGTVETGFVYAYYNNDGLYDSGWCYVNKDLSLATGWSEIGGTKYYFDGQGFVKSGLVKIEGKLYYLGDFDSELAKQNKSVPVEKGFVENLGGRNNYWSKNIYYINDDLSLQVGWMNYKGRKFYFDEDGILQSGITRIGNCMYYLGDISFDDLKAGKVSPISTGFYQKNSYDSIYYIYDDLKLATGWTEVKGKLCKFDDNGAMQSGWQVKDNKWYYLGSTIDNYGVETDCWYDNCWLGPDGAWDESYTMAWYEDDWGWYILDNNGWYPYSEWQKIDGVWYYFDEWGYMIRSTWRNIGGTYYYFNFNGSLASGAYLNGKETGQWIDGYWVDHSGAWTGRSGYWVWDGTGYKLYDNTGWSPVNESIIIDQSVISFNELGYAYGWGGNLYTVPPMGGAPSATKDSVIQYACRSLGFPYVYGGQTMAGTDCSGFTMLSWSYAGYSLPHNAGLQYSTYAANEVWISEAQPGDLFFYYSGDIENDAGTGIGHTALYIGNGETLEAGDTTNGNRWYDAGKAVYIIK